MIHFGLAILSFVLTLVAPAPARIESAFLGNNADALKPLLAPGQFLSLSVSGPVAFSDVLSDEQTILWFRKFFRSAKTLGFYPAAAAPLKFDRGAFVYKARWEVQTGEGKPVAYYDVLFLIRNRFAGGTGPVPVKGIQGIWTILQIRADER